MDSNSLETFYVYRSLHSDESWGAALGCGTIASLPNIDFGMTVYASNEKEAIARARDLYERIHHLDSDRNNVREFAKEALNSVVRSKLRKGEKIEGKEKEIAKSTMKVAVEMNDEFKRHFENVGGHEIQSAKDAIADERCSRQREVDNSEEGDREVQGFGTQYRQVFSG